ncbi:MAG: hypothetical protein M3R00_08445, partial [Pseudomonadota bacterium]|nr:hypothetical protein [Pseudomonadota bacterium]
AILLNSIIDKASSSELKQKLKPIVEKNPELRNSNTRFLSYLTDLLPLTDTTEIKSAIIQKISQKNFSALREGIESNLKPLKTLLEDNVPKDLLNELENLANRITDLDGFLRNIYPIQYPYGLNFEKTLINQIISFDSLNLTIKTLMTLVKSVPITPQFAEAIAQWLIVIDKSHLTPLFTKLEANNFHMMQIIMTEFVIDVIALIFPALGISQQFEMKSMLQTNHPYLFSACLGLGYFEKALHWLMYCEKVTNSYSSSTMYHYLYHVCDLKIGLVTLARRSGDYDKALELLRRSKKWLIMRQKSSQRLASPLT